MSTFFWIFSLQDTLKLEPHRTEEDIMLTNFNPSFTFMKNRILILWNNHIDIFLFVLCAIITCVGCGANFLALDKNLICSDEGWYLCLLRDCPHMDSATKFYLLFDNIFHNNIYAIRLFCWALQIIGSIVFAIGLYTLLIQYDHTRKRPYWLFLSFFAIYLGQMSIVDCPSLNYVTLNKIITEYAIGFFLIGLTKNKDFLICLSGFFIAYLFPVMITNVIIIPIMIVVLLLLSKNRHLQKTLFFLLGISLFALYYFIFVESPKEVMSFLLDQSANTIKRGKQDYGILFLCAWLYQTGIYLLRCGIAAVLLYVCYQYGKHFKSTRHQWKRWSWTLISSSIVLLYLWKYMQPTTPWLQYSSFPWLKDIIWIIIFICIIDDVRNQRLLFSQRILVAFFILVPICLSFGSNVPFYVRGADYYLFLWPIILLMYQPRTPLLKTLILLIISLQFLAFGYTCCKKNWYGDSFFRGEKIPVKTIGINQNLKLNKKYIEILNFCKSNIPNGKILCSRCGWYIVDLLDYQPISHEYNYALKDADSFSDLIDDAIHQDGHLWVISDSESDYDFQAAIENIHNKNIQIIEYKDCKCYYITNKLQ